MFGYRRFISLQGIEYFDPVESENIESDVKSQVDTLYDMIFVRDPNTGFPSGDITQYLSDKTSDEVKKFIEDTLLRDVGTGEGLALDDDIRSEFKKLPSDFIAACSRNAYEDVESYEARVSNYIENQRKQMKAEKDWENSPFNLKNKKDDNVS